MSLRHAFTVDLEEWYHGVELDPADWPSESRLHVGLDRLVALLDEHRITATFFVLGVVAERFPDVVGELARGGHEIGCHGHAHEFVYRQTTAGFRADVVRARDAIGAATGVAPTAYRAPYFSIRDDSRWAFDVLAEEGFHYDTSVFPVRNDRYGIPDAPREPFDITTSSGPLREVPLTPVRVARWNVPFSGGAYLRILPATVQALAWRLAERQGVRVVAYIHPWELDPDHPRVRLRRRVAATHYARLGVTERRLRRLFADHRFGRLDDVFAVA
jgi:polysaccharide deacetylase family protein (PEP-CTERM system associated)